MNYFRLNLDINPIRDTFNLEHNNGDFWHVYVKVTDVLNDWVLEKFNSLGLIPNSVVIFSSPENQRKQGFLHKDLIWKANKWQTVPCAVNWELRPVRTRIQWYDTTQCKEYWPDKNFYEIDYPLNYLNGIGYSTPDCHNVFAPPGMPDKSVLLQETVVDYVTPILFRTDHAHCITYESDVQDRFMCSVRFENIDSWEHAIEKFDSVIYKENFW